MAYKNTSDLNLTRLYDDLFGRALRLADTEVPVTGTRYKSTGSNRYPTIYRLY